MTDVSNLDDLAAAISTGSAKIRKYALAQAAATQSQELDIQAALAQGGGQQLPPLYIDVRAHGAKFDGVTDDTAAIQAALDAAPLANYMGMPSPIDWPARRVVMPPGRARVSAPLKLPSNVWLSGAGEASTYLVNYAAGNTLELKTGGEVQVQLRDFGVICIQGQGNGINLTQTGAPSILGDPSHLVENVVLVGGKCALKTWGGSEVRVVNVKAYRQRPPAGEAAVNLGGHDLFVERVTVAQPQQDGTPQGGSGLRSGTSNSRFVNCKVFGGSATVNGSMQSGFYLIGQRNLVIGLEVQDYAGGWGVQCDQPNNIFHGLVVDSCQGGGLFAGAGGVVVKDALFVQRDARPFAMPYALSVPDNTAAEIAARVVGIPDVFAPPHTGAGNFITVNGV